MTSHLDYYSVVNDAGHSAHVTPLFCDLHWFQVQFKVLIITFKVLHGLGPGYFRDHLSPVVSAHPIQSGRMGMPQIKLAKKCQLTGPKRHVFSVINAHLVEHSPSVD